MPVSPFWGYNPLGEFGTSLLAIPGVLEQAQNDFKTSPSLFFPFLANFSLAELSKFKPFELDWTAVDEEGNTFFHFLARQSFLVKGHINFALDMKADSTFSMKNKEGDTPFTMKSSGRRGVNLKEYQIYFENIILPRTLRKHLKEQGAKTIAPTRPSSRL